MRAGRAGANVASRTSRGLTLEPGADLLIDRRMAEQVEMRHAAEVPAAVGLERDPPLGAVPRCARVEDQQVADDAPDWAAGLVREGRADEVEGGVVTEGHVAAAVGEELVGVAVAPVLLDAGAVAEVLAPGAAAVHELGEGARLRQPVQRPAARV